MEAVLQGGDRVPVTLLTQHPDSALCLVTLDTADTELLDEKKKETAPWPWCPRASPRLWSLAASSSRR